MEPTVFVLGAGASCGDTLEFPDDYKGDRSDKPPKPALTNQFFDEAHVGLDPSEVENRHRFLFGHIRGHWGIKEPLGTGRWNTLSIEDVFSSISLLYDFVPVGTDDKSHTQLLLSDLAKYIRRSISMSTMFRFDVHTSLLASKLAPCDAVINSNYDLLMDQELLSAQGPVQYQNFSVKFLGKNLFDAGKEYEEVRNSLLEPVAPASNNGPSGPTEGLYLKPHGSLNWFICPNLACPKSHNLAIVPSVGQALGISALGMEFQCNYCQTELSAFLIPPLAQKPVMSNPHLRNIWGNAFGFSAMHQRS